MVVFEQTPQFKDGEIIVVYLARTNSIGIKYGFTIEDSVILVSNNEAPTKLISGNGDQVIGVYRECWKKSRST